MGDKRVQAVDDACEKYLADNTAWKTAGRARTKSRDSVENVMKKAKLERYEYDGRVFRFDHTEKLVIEKKEKE